MIKRIIFDLDNTIIDWKDYYSADAVKSACDKFGIKYNNEIIEKIVNIVDYYERNNEYFNMNIMQELINKELNNHYTTDFTKEILKYFENCVPKEMDINIIRTLEYLQNKYELVILTNWFENTQIQRLKNTKIYKYFTHVYATEKIKVKPNKEAFKTAMGEFAPNECVMVGDDLKIDIDGALNIGINAIFLNRKNISVDKKYTVITHLDELIKIL